MLKQGDMSLGSPASRLALTYLAIIMSLTVLFSIVIYSISSAQLDRPLSPRGAVEWFSDAPTRSSLQQLFDDRAEEARLNLVSSLVILNATTLIAGSFLSYFLARRTLAPIEAAIEAQNRFVSDASHELRTPLTALQVTNEVALRKKKLSLTQAKELIGHNVAETVKLQVLTNSLLTLIRSDHGDNSAKQTVNIPEVVLGVIATFQPVADARRITIAHTVSQATVRTNEVAVSQILGIFIDNALKYSPNGSTITLTSLERPNSILLNVTDEGIGIANEQHAHVFERFWRADQSRSSQHVEGNGLGLAIAHSTADRHGFSLTVSSPKNGGSTFGLELPR